MEQEKHSLLHEKQFQNEEDTPQNHQDYHSNIKWGLSSRSLLVIWIALVSLTCSGVVLYLLVERQSVVSVTPGGRLWPTDGAIYSCGDSVPEAKSLGCIFDIMSFTWVHPACDDPELTAEFETARDWKWYIEYHGERGNVGLISIEDIRTGNFDAWVPWEYHTLHCTFLWRKMHRALIFGRPMDNYIADYNHTTHCQEMLLKGEWRGNDQVNTHVSRKFTTCGYTIS
jgi:hypothetical protein